VFPQSPDRWSIIIKSVSRWTFPAFRGPSLSPGLLRCPRRDPCPPGPFRFWIVAGLYFFRECGGALSLNRGAAFPFVQVVSFLSPPFVSAFPPPRRRCYHICWCPLRACVWLSLELSRNRFCRPGVGPFRIFCVLGCPTSFPIVLPPVFSFFFPLSRHDRRPGCLVDPLFRQCLFSKVISEANPQVGLRGPRFPQVGWSFFFLLRRHPAHQPAIFLRLETSFPYPAATGFPLPSLALFFPSVLLISGLFLRRGFPVPFSRRIWAWLGCTLFLFISQTVQGEVLGHVGVWCSVVSLFFGAIGPVRGFFFSWNILFDPISLVFLCGWQTIFSLRL